MANDTKQTEPNNPYYGFKKPEDIIQKANAAADTPIATTFSDANTLSPTEEVWHRLYGYNATGSLSSNIIEAGKQIIDSITDMADTTLSSFKGKAYFPQVRSAKSIVDQVLEHFTPTVSRSLFPPAGFAEILEDTFVRQAPIPPPKDPSMSEAKQWYESAKYLVKNDPLLHFMGMKARFPTIDTQQVMYMSYFGRRMAPDGFNQFSPLVASYNTLMLSDTMRLHYTVGRLSKLYREFVQYETAKKDAIQRGVINWKTDDAVTSTSIGNLVYYDYAKTYEFYAKLFKAVSDQYKPDRTSKVYNAEMKGKVDKVLFKTYSDQSIGINNKLPYLRLQNEAVIKIDKFYLFLEELKEYTESYKYGWKTVETLFSNYQYYSGGDQQSVSFKARLYYTNRKYWNYFIRLANSNRFLDFKVGHHPETRKLLITSLDCSYTFQYGKTFLKMPEPAWAEFTIKGVIKGEPLASFNLNYYKDDPSLMSVISKEERISMINDEKRARQKAPPQLGLLANRSPSVG